jgi:hypothetical protein
LRDMDTYTGFEPRVGEVRALRTFRVGRCGVLYPLFVDAEWRDGTNTARCHRPAGAPHSSPGQHAAPDPDCTCGFYAYGSEAAAGDHPHGRHVLAVVACWGRLIAGTRGLRAEHARIEALWLSEAVPAELAAQVRDRYPSVAVHDDRARMLLEHPITELDCYEPPALWSRPRRDRALTAAALGAIVVGLLPMGWLGGPHPAAAVWAVIGVLFLGLSALRGRRRGADPVANRQRLLGLAVGLWMLAPFAGSLGFVLLRLPLLEVAGLALLHRYGLRRDASRFPADIG